MQLQEYGVTKIDIEEDDLLIRRVSNGWLVKSVSPSDENYIISRVFEDSDHDFNIAASSSLRNLIHDCFDSYMQSKRSPGLVVSLKEKGWCEDEN